MTVSSLFVSAAASLAIGQGAGPVSASGARAFETVQSLVTEVGPRLAGTPAEARARDWAVARLKRLGFDNVHIELTDMPLWLRGEEHAEIVAPYPQPLAVTAIGRSGATPAKGISGRLVYFRGLDELRAAPASVIKGRIVFVDHAMRRTVDESQYSAFAEVRRSAPAIASGKGAAAIVIRSLGTDHHRNAHTGLTMWGDARPIPASAVSLADADTLGRLATSGKPIELRLVLTPRSAGTGPTGNVIAEIPGSRAPSEVVLVGAHLDSWDLGQGAEDDGAGVAIVMEAAKRILERGSRPRRTIRIVLFGCEELGLSGANDYASRHGGDRHVAAIEMDHGSGPVLQLASDVNEASLPAIARIAHALSRFGVVQGRNDVRLGTDLNPLRQLGVPTISLHQDGWTYFDIHHTPDDTLDKVDAVGLDQASTVLSEVLWALADGSESFSRPPKK